MARLLALLVLGCVQAVAAPLHIRVLDVGEGQSVLLHSNNRAILVDAGHAGAAAEVLGRMQELGIRDLDYLILTHLHPDHASAYFRIHEQFPQAMVLDNCHSAAANSSVDMVRWVYDALQRNPRRRCVQRGDVIEWEDTVVAVLWPTVPLAPESSLNHGSLVLQVSRDDLQLLIMGDADTQAEARLLEIGSLRPVEVLVAGHHGASDASSEAFLQTVRPRYSVISINSGNIRGYPSPQTLHRIKQTGSRLHTTYDDGEAHFVFD